MGIDFSLETLRLVIFIGALLSFSGLEALLPRKTRTSTRRRRWPTNLAFALINTAALQLLVPLAAVGTAAWASQTGFGLFNNINISTAISALVSIILLDAALYWQHVATHKIPILWRLHKVHHTDRDLDASSGIRFHPVEIVLSMAFKMLIVAGLGVSVMAVIIFEIILNACALFNHANIRLPSKIDAVMRVFIATPDYHRVHHSAVEDETNSNYGFSLTLWDRVFGTYKPQPKAGHDNMVIGLAQHQNTGPTRLLWSLALPFKR